MDAPTLASKKLVRPALLTIALYFSVIVIAMITTAKPAQASGTVNASVLYWGGTSNSGYDCTGMTSLGAVQSCELAKRNKWLADDLSYLNGFPNATPKPLTCATAVLTDSGPSNPYVDVFEIAFYRGAYNVGGFWIPINYLFCDGPRIDHYFINTSLTCPANSAPTGSTCTCDNSYVPGPDGKSCVPEPYTIALSGLGGEVLPTRTRAAYAEVIKSDGSPKSGAAISLLLTVVPENGDPIRAEHVGRVSPNGGSTGADGRLNFEFIAPLAGGTHTIAASCPTCTNIYAEGTITVPGCPEPPLTSPPFTDPVAAGFENGNRWRPDRLSTAPQNNYQTKLACVEAAITAAGGTSTGTSAYRPFQYQQHLYEIVNKDVTLNSRYMTAHPECQTLRAQVTQEMTTGHGLGPNQLVAIPGTSRHESGTAFDLTPPGLTAAQRAEVYAGCGVTNTAVASERWHTQ